MSYNIMAKKIIYLMLHDLQSSQLGLRENLSCYTPSRWNSIEEKQVRNMTRRNAFFFVLFSHMCVAIIQQRKDGSIMANFRDNMNVKIPSGFQFGEIKKLSTKHKLVNIKNFNHLFELVVDLIKKYPFPSGRLLGY